MSSRSCSDSTLVESRETAPLLKKGNDAPARSGPTWHDIAVCSLAYTLATLFVFSPLRVVLGPSSSKHTVATTAVWFHPARTQGNLIEVLYYTVGLLAIALAVSLCATTSVRLSHWLDLPSAVNTVMLICWLSGALGTMGVMKVRANNMSFNTATSAAIIFLVSVLLREDSAQYGALPFDQLMNYLKMVAIGAMISSTTSVLFYHKSSLDRLGRDSRALGELYATMCELLVGTFGRKMDPQFQEANEKANGMLSDLIQQHKYAKYEMIFKAKLPWRALLGFQRQKQCFRDNTDRLASLQRQSMHLGGMVHCASVVSSFASGEHPQLQRLRRPMLAFATKLARYSQEKKHTATGDNIMNQELMTYSHARDAVLRSSSIMEENSLQAASVLFSHLLQDIGREIIAGTTREPSLEAQADAILSQQQFNLGSSSDKTNEQFNQLDEALFPKRKAKHHGIGPRLWKLLQALRNLDVRHGIRVALGAMVLCIPAYVPDYRPIFQRWHGEWAMITFMIIMARNLGAMTKNIPLRIAGTSLGATIGIVVSVACRQNGVFLAIVGLFVSFGCYRRILSKVNPVFGRFVLLSYNLVCLYSFSLHVDGTDDNYNERMEPIYDIAFHRVLSVVVGILWAVFITLTIWPHSARQALRSNLCIQWMRMGMVWKSDPLAVIPISETTTGLSPATGLVRFRGISSERELQAMMLDLDVLLKNSPNEFRLRGKFDPAPYKQLLESTQTILDAFHSISILIEDEPVATAREQDLGRYTQDQRRELCHLLFLQFYTASASVRLGFPVPELLPSPDQPLAELASKVSERRREMGAPEPYGSLSQDNYDFVLFYSYHTVVLTVSSELKLIHEALREIFGSLDDDTLFASHHAAGASNSES